MDERKKIVTIKVVDLMIGKISQPSTITGFIQICSASTVLAAHHIIIQIVAGSVSIVTGIWDIWRRELTRVDLELAKELGQTKDGATQGTQNDQP